MKRALGRRWHRIAATFSVACLLLQGLLAQGMALTLRAPASVGLAFAESGPARLTMVICSAHGAKTITVDAEGNRVDGPINQPAPGDPRLSCSMCVAIGTFVFAGPACTLAVPATSGSKAPVAEPQDGARRNASVRVYRNRDPPGGVTA